MGEDLQGSDDHGGGDRSDGTSQRDSGVEPAELSNGSSQEEEAGQREEGRETSMRTRANPARTKKAKK